MGPGWGMTKVSGLCSQVSWFILSCFDLVTFKTCFYFKEIIKFKNESHANTEDNSLDFCFLPAKYKGFYCIFFFYHDKYKHWE